MEGQTAFDSAEIITLHHHTMHHKLYYSSFKHSHGDFIIIMIISLHYIDITSHINYSMILICYLIHAFIFGSITVVSNMHYHIALYCDVQQTPPNALVTNYILSIQMLSSVHVCTPMIHRNTSIQLTFFRQHSLMSNHDQFKDRSIQCMRFVTFVLRIIALFETIRIFATIHNINLIRMLGYRP
eukprot:733037_1